MSWRPVASDVKAGEPPRERFPTNQAATAANVEEFPIRIALVALTNASIKAGEHRWHRSPLQLTIESTSDYRRFGRSLAAADIDGNGFPDLIVGQPRLVTSAGSGGVFVFHGAGLELFSSAASLIEGGRGQSMFGVSVANAGDVNGDGLPDMVIGSPFYSNGEKFEGAFFLLHGKRTGTNYRPEFRLESNHPAVQLGNAVASAGDVNGDGFGDVLVGAPRNAVNSRHEGSAYLYFGSATGLVARALWTCSSHQYEARCGQSVAGGDVNHDGYSDVLVGMPDFDAGAIDAGRVALFLGSKSGPKQTPDWSLDGPYADAHFGAALAIGDLNEDGYADLLVGAPGPEQGSNLSGWVYAYLGTSNGLARSPSWSVTDHQLGARFGAAIASLGDSTGDRHTDVLIGAPDYDGTLVNQGRAYLFLGATSGLAATPDWILEGGQSGALCGEAIAAASDLNQDGLTDFAIGASGFTTRKTREGRVDVFLGSRTAYQRRNEFPANGTSSAALSRQQFLPQPPNPTGQAPIFPFAVIYLGGGGLVLALGAGLILWRRKSRANLHEERQRLARDLHDDLGAKLTRISVLTELVRRAAASSEAGRQNAELLTQTAQEVLAGMEQVIWSVNPANDTLENLVIFIVQYAGPFLAPTGIELRPESSATLPDRPLPANLRKSIFLSVKEALNNVVKHANATQVGLRINYEAPFLSIVIEDDGRGVKVRGNGARDLTPSGSDGLKNMRDRMSEAGGTFAIDQPPGGGTRVTLRVRV